MPQIKFTASLILFALFMIFIANFAGVDKNLVFDGSDEAMYQAARNEAISITFGYDSGFHWGGALGNGSDVDLDLALQPGYFMRTITIYSDVEITVTYTGEGIDAVNGDDTFSEVIPAGKSVTWDFTNLTDLNIDNASGSTSNYEVYIRCARTRSIAP